MITQDDHNKIDLKDKKERIAADELHALNTQQRGMYAYIGNHEIKMGAKFSWYSIILVSYKLI